MQERLFNDNSIRIEALSQVELLNGKKVATSNEKKSWFLKYAKFAKFRGCQKFFFVKSEKKRSSFHLLEEKIKPLKIDDRVTD